MLINERLGFLLPILILLFAPAASAQQPAQPTQPASAKIYLDVVVTPKSGAPVGGLQQQDFTVLDNKVPQIITSFKTVTGREAPIEVVLVIDTVNTTAQTVSYARLQIDKFLRAEGGHLAYPVAVAVFTDRGTQIVGNFSDDGNALAATLQQDNPGLRDIGRSAGFYGATERWQLSLQALRQLIAGVAPHPGRKLMIWLSPGWPLLSGPDIQLDSKQQQQAFTDIVNFSTQLLQGRITLYSIDPLGTDESLYRESHYEEFLKGISKPSQIDMADLALPVVAMQSGGLALHASNDLAGLVQQCVAETPYYEISFDPPPAKQQDEYHHLEIRVAKSGLTARTREGYYAQPSPRN
jgi:VWFA-related protein